MSHYSCQGCKVIVDWDTDEPTSDIDTEWKTIGGRYCVRCIPLEAAANGLTVGQIIDDRRRRGRPVPMEIVTP